MRKGNKERVQQGRQGEFIDLMVSRLLEGKRDSNPIVAKFAAEYEINDKDIIKELVELAIVKVARTYAQNPRLSDEEKYYKIIDLYNQQVNLAHRTSQSIMLQQYSTPAPIAFLASLFVKQANPDGVFWEPSAGNGLLTIAIPPGQVVVNEIDDLRNINLQRQGYRAVHAQDATEEIPTTPAYFDGVMTNPPFGRIDTIQFKEAHIKVLEHAMAIRALEKMKDDGRAAIIIGGHLTFDKAGRIQAGKNMIFYAYLHKYYHVLDSINIDGKKLYSRQGTSFDVRLILIEGRKVTPGGFPPVKSDQDKEVVSTYERLWERVSPYLQTKTTTVATENFESIMLEQEALALELELELLKNKGLNGLEGPYYPVSQADSLEVEVPDSMDYETHQAVARIAEEVGNLDEYVREKLGYPSREKLYSALKAEQIDSVAMAIYNMEVRGQGIIIGDQTGIGKGRQAAAIIRYAVLNGHKPIFLTEKPNLFSDIYRDLKDIGSADLKPFIVNARDAKTHIKDSDGKVVYQAMEPAAHKAFYKKFSEGRGSLADLEEYDYIISLYSQFRDKDMTAKKLFLIKVAQNNILILDEAHNSSGSSNTGAFLQDVTGSAKGVTFLSATFAKRPDNMPIYSMKTAMSDANMSKDELVEAITRGGVALQEVLASQLVDEGQMVRRQRTYEGIEVNYITLTAEKENHRVVCDRVTEIIRDVIAFQEIYIHPEVQELDKIAVAEGEKITGGPTKAGVDSTPYFSKVFNVINQLLFSIKAEAVAEKAIARLREGKKPVLAFSSTMGSFLKDMIDDSGEKVSNGSIVKADFAEVLKKGLDSVMKITKTDPFGKKVKEQLSISNFSPEAQVAYLNIMKKINRASTGICISPIDVLTKRLSEAGYTYAEVTGRDMVLQLDDNLTSGLVVTRKKQTATDAFRKFNNNEVDCLLINQSGSTGASAHAVPTAKVPKDKVKQRVMIVLQAELDINTEVQKRGRINRTGQIMKPIYDYLISEIPAEKRLMMMLQKKLKSLDANTSSNQKNSEDLLSTADFLNKYGDKIVFEYLSENLEINSILGDPLNIESNEDEDKRITEGAAHRVSGRVAILSTSEQERFYNEILERYNELVEYKKQIGEYDLEVEAMDLQTETLDKSVVKVGKTADSIFGNDSYLETVRARVLKKPFKKVEIENMLAEALGSREAKEVQGEILTKFGNFMRIKLQESIEIITEKTKKQIENIPNEKSIQKALPEMRQQAIRDRESELKEAANLRIQKENEQTDNRISYLNGFFAFFYPGRPILYPKQVYGGTGDGLMKIPGICLGFQIDERKPNPYAPSAITLKFALASSDKFVALKASGDTSLQISAIKGATYDMSESQARNLLNDWDELTKEAAADFSIRHIITGNLLQAFSSFSGKLVSYTTNDGSIKKGILLPEQFNPEESVGGKISVPLFKCAKVIKALPSGQLITTNNNIGFLRQGDDFKIIVPGARSKGGDIYLDQDLLDLTDEGTFNKTGDAMVAWVSYKNIDRFIEVAQKNHSPSVELDKEQYDMIADQIEKPKAKKVMDLPQRKEAQMPDQTAPEMDEAELMMMLELEAEALELELKLLKQAA